MTQIQLLSKLNANQIQTKHKIYTITHTYFSVIRLSVWHNARVLWCYSILHYSSTQYDYDVSGQCLTGNICSYSLPVYLWVNRLIFIVSLVIYSIGMVEWWLDSLGTGVAVSRGHCCPYQSCVRSACYCIACESWMQRMQRAIWFYETSRIRDSLFDAW